MHNITIEWKPSGRFYHVFCSCGWTPGHKLSFGSGFKHRAQFYADQHIEESSEDCRVGDVK